jgi:hypothetical protein
VSDDEYHREQLERYELMSRSIQRFIAGGKSKNTGVVMALAATVRAAGEMLWMSDIEHTNEVSRLMMVGERAAAYRILNAAYEPLLGYRVIEPGEDIPLSAVERMIAAAKARYELEEGS